MEEGRKQAFGEARDLIVATKLPFVGLPGFPMEELLELLTNPRALRGLLTEYLKQYLSDVERTREALRAEPKRIYTLDVLMKGAKRKLGVRDGSACELILDYAAQDASRMSWPHQLKIIAMFALSMVAVLAPGGLIAGVAIAAHLGLGVHDLRNAIETYEENSAAARLGLRSVDALLTDVVLALMGLGLAAADALRFATMMPKLKAALTQFEHSRNLGQLRNNLVALGLDHDQVEAILGVARSLKSGRPHLGTLGQALNASSDPVRVAATWNGLREGLDRTRQLEELAATLRQSLGESSVEAQALLRLEEKLAVLRSRLSEVDAVLPPGRSVQQLSRLTAQDFAQLKSHAWIVEDALEQLQKLTDLMSGFITVHVRLMNAGAFTLSLKRLADEALTKLTSLQSLAAPLRRPINQFASEAAHELTQLESRMARLRRTLEGLRDERPALNISDLDSVEALLAAKRKQLIESYDALGPIEKRLRELADLVAN